MSEGPQLSSSFPYKSSRLCHFTKKEFSGIFFARVQLCLDCDVVGGTNLLKEKRMGNIAGTPYKAGREKYTNGPQQGKIVFQG